MLTHWIWLAERPEVSTFAKWQLLQHFSDPEAAYNAQGYEGITDLSPQALESLADKDLTDASAILDRCIRGNIHLLTIFDAAYPDRLKQIYDPPIVLYYKGTLPVFDALPVIGIVGTRHPSPYGAKSAARMGYEIAAGGALVVSGIAMGVDAVSMSGALRAGKNTVGVVGCGVDIIYPKSNTALYDQVEHCGCILSEFAPGTPPYKWNFPRRNRIISGLSCGVVVVEAPVKSGSLITARQAVEQGRDVFVIPGNVDAESFAGSNRLLRSGAVAVTCGWDVLSEYEHLFPAMLKKAEAPENLPTEAETPAQMPAPAKKKPAKTDSPLKKPIDNAASAPYIDVNDILTGLTPDEQTVVRAITQPEQPVAEVIDAAGMSAGKVLAILTLLELKGKVRRHPGSRVSLSVNK